MADIFLVEELLERHRLVQFVKNVDLLLLGEIRLVGRRLHMFAQPFALLQVQQMLEFRTDLATVGVTQQFDDHPERGLFIASQPAAVEFTVEIPEGEPVVFQVEFRAVARLIAQRVQIRQHMPAGAVHVDQPVYSDRSFVLLEGGPTAFQLSHVGIFPKRDRFVGNLQVGEDRVVEVLPAVEQVIDLFQEFTRFRSLDHPVIVGRGDRHDLADTELVQHLLRHRLVFHRVVDRPGCDNGTLIFHQPRNRGNRADHPRVGQCDGGVTEIGEFKISTAGFFNQITVGVEKLLEIHRIHALDVGHQEIAGAILALYIHGHTQVHLLRFHFVGFPIPVDEGVVHIRILLQRLYHGPGDEMGQGSFRLAALFQMPVDDGAVFNQHLCRHLANRGGRRHLETLVHILHDLAGHPFDLFKGRTLREIGGLFLLLSLGLFLLFYLFSFFLFLLLNLLKLLDRLLSIAGDSGFGTELLGRCFTLDLIKIQFPVGGYRGGILVVLFVEFLHKGGIGTKNGFERLQNIGDLDD